MEGKSGKLPLFRLFWPCLNSMIVYYFTSLYMPVLLQFPSSTACQAYSTLSHSI